LVTDPLERLYKLSRLHRAVDSGVNLVGQVAVRDA
jgi:hypothetical protein